MNINEDFFQEDVKNNLFSIDHILYAVVSHGDNGLISQEIGIVNRLGKIIEYFIHWDNII